MIFVGGSRHGTAFLSHERPVLVRMAPGDHPEVQDPGKHTTPDPDSYVDIITAQTYYRREFGITLQNPLTGKPNAHAHRTKVYVHESLVWGTPQAMATLQDAVLRWLLATFGEEVMNPLLAQQNGNRPQESDKETPA